jgi:hypothetical protein
MADYDAIPKDKRDKETGTEDNPLPLISFKDRSKKNLDLHKRKLLMPLTMASCSTALILYSEIHISSWFEVK